MVAQSNSPNTQQDILRSELSKHFPLDKINEVLTHYEILRKEYRLRDYEKCLVNGGKFVEAVLKCLHYLRTGNKIDKISKVNDEIKALENATNLTDSIRMNIPRILYGIYELRSKRGGAHNFSFDPIHMDSVFVVSATSWVMEELTRLYYTSDPNASQALVENLLVKEISIVEELDGDYLVHIPQASARVQLEILLYHHYPKRCLIKDLQLWVKNQTVKNVQTSLRGLVEKNFVHKNSTGYILTEPGVKHAEAELTLLSGIAPTENTAVKHVKKGVKRGNLRKPATSQTKRRPVSR